MSTLNKTKIEYLTHTWNPITGCDPDPISPGCDHCWARKRAKMMAGKYGYPEKAPFTPGTFHENKMHLPGGKKKIIGVCFMGDMFHDAVDPRRIHNIFSKCTWHPHDVYVFLTKRPAKMLRATDDFLEFHDGAPELPRNWFFGATTENQKYFDERMEHLALIRGRRFISAEPLLGPIDISRYADRLDWVIVGGETGGSFARPMNPDWVRSLRNQCQKFGIPFFFKSWGYWRWSFERGQYHDKDDGSALLDGREWKEFPA